MVYDDMNCLVMADDDHDVATLRLTNDTLLCVMVGQLVLVSKEYSIMCHGTDAANCIAKEAKPSVKPNLWAVWLRTGLGQNMTC